MKNAQGLSMTTIVIAALSLLVLVILVLIFTGRMSLFSGGVDESNACSNYCKSLGKELEDHTIKTADTGVCTGTHIPGVVWKKAGDKESYKCCCQSKADSTDPEFFFP